MKLTPEKIAEWKSLVPKLNDDSYDHMDVAHSADMPPEHTVNYRHARNAEEAAWAIHSLIADLEEARGMVVTLAPDALREAEERKNIAAGLEVVWQGRMRDAETAHQAELEATRKQLAEAQALIHAGQPTLDSSSIESVVAFWSTQCWRRAALDAAIAEAIADEKRNPWKQAIINELAVSHVLHTDHETDPVRALAALVDYECKVALDPVVSKEAQELIEPYRKDTERLDWLGKLCKETPLRPNAFCSEIAPDTRLKYEFPTLVSYDAIGQQISLRDAIDAAIAAKVKNE